MYLIKTAEGQQAFKSRHADLSPRLRPAFLLFDGQRSLAQVLEATAGFGVVQEDVLALVDRGWLSEAAAPNRPPAAEGEPAKAKALPRSPDLAPTQELHRDDEGADPAIPPQSPSAASRYQKAYPMAVSMTGGLGLKGFRLNLAVEAASGYEQLAELAPRIRDAVGEKAYAPLYRALFEQG